MCSDKCSILQSTLQHSYINKKNIFEKNNTKFVYNLESLQEICHHTCLDSNFLRSLLYLYHHLFVFAEQRNGLPRRSWHGAGSRVAATLRLSKAALKAEIFTTVKTFTGSWASFIQTHHGELGIFFLFVVFCYKQNQTIFCYKMSI